MGSILTTVNYVKRIKMHILALNQCILMIENIEIYLSYKNLSIKEIFEILSDDVYSTLTFIKSISNNMNMNNDINLMSVKNIKFINDNKFLNGKDKENVIGFFSTLGKSDTNGQILNCKTYKEIFKKSLYTLEKNANIDSKSTGTIIIGTGLLFIIFII